MNQLLLFLALLSLSLKTWAWSFHALVKSPTRVLSYGKNCCRLKSPLFVAVLNEPCVKWDIGSMMKNIKNKKEEYNEKLDKIQSERRLMQTKEQAYLKGVKLDELPKSFSETAFRSMLKAFVWRVIAGGITFTASVKYSANIHTALKIVSSDFLSKASTMYIGERLMNKSQAGRESGNDSPSRSMTKVIMWRVFAICNSLVASLCFAKDFNVASKIAGSDALFKTGLMFLYERFWSNIAWGKEYSIEFTI